MPRRKLLRINPKWSEYNSDLGSSEGGSFSSTLHAYLAKYIRKIDKALSWNISVIFHQSEQTRLPISWNEYGVMWCETNKLPYSPVYVEKAFMTLIYFLMMQLFRRLCIFYYYLLDNQQQDSWKK